MNGGKKAELTIRARFEDRRKEPLGLLRIILDKKIKSGLRNVIIFLPKFTLSSTLMSNEISNDYYNIQVDIDIVSMNEEYHKTLLKENQLAHILNNKKNAKFLNDTSGTLRSRESIEKEMQKYNTESKIMASELKTYFEKLLGIEF